ncbi:MULTISPECIES: DUF1186 domain-containing protein [unclassified Inquilinus]|uniref:DUF1186 domain-containing protein n=1 Tax=unclassified Inquilinus TaxID=2645927 RepID=UPI003F8FFF12
MTVDEMIRDLAAANGVLPADAMNWALEHWDDAGPRCVEFLERHAGGAQGSKGVEDALFFIIHLAGEMRETRAFPHLCRMIRGPEAEHILGDADTETLGGILINTFDGDPAPLKAVIEDAGAGDYMRDAALDALAWHCRMGAISDEEMKAYLLHLYEHMQPRDENVVWLGWVTAVFCLGYEGLAPRAERLIDDFLVPPGFMEVEDFHDELRRTLDDPERMAGFIDNHIGPFVDAVGTLSTWSDFSEDDQAELDSGLAEDDEDGDLDDLLLSDRLQVPLHSEPVTDPLRHVGRNDPCPCGSGKKYKKCCLQ